MGTLEDPVIPSFLPSKKASMPPSLPSSRLVTWALVTLRYHIMLPPVCPCSCCALVYSALPCHGLRDLC